MEIVEYSDKYLEDVKDLLVELEEYRTIMEQSDRLVLPQQVRPILISVANFELLLKEGRSFEEYFQYRDNQNVIKTEESVVGEDAVLPGGPRDQENQEDIISQEESSENIATEEQSQPTEEEQSEPEESANSEEEIIEENEQTVGESE